ncbi:hypothetical protein KIJ96_06835 [Pseudoalteromonas piscicida]|uniref:DNA methyltransferase n=1 Tax=Pseudoalteromonas piscicida TaxID=43662 RepID=UPI001D0A416E|nr:class I SAM-dependent methyltransferase [Pseudoalteromonas piscicida]UDM62951.1 hypothetical protein KIJ96_06835 [Pseudoalteromonas piscicida]
MSRIVIETTKKQKEALSSKLNELGKSFKEWFDEKLDSTVDHHIPFNEQYIFEEATNSKHISSSAKVRTDVEQADLSFSDSDTSYLTHDIHPYPAKYIPQIPSNFIRRLSLTGDIVLDPFGGSGTTATEAARLNRRAISLDANPIAALLAEVKATVLSDLDKNELAMLYETVKSYLNKDVVLPDKSTLDSYIPEIPNHEKWFSEETTIELALVRKLIEEISTKVAVKVAQIALSRIIVRVSFQDSETRYVSKPREVKTKATLKTYLDSLNVVLKKLVQFENHVLKPSTQVFLGDSRESMQSNINSESVGLIVTSPPYANATDYHLYHRFRIFWLGFSPKSFADVEIGSHLKHQRKKSGFDEYLEDMNQILRESYRVLMSGRYAVFIVGDSIFKEQVYNTAESLKELAIDIGFEHVVTVERQLPENRRSFAKPARRARGERVLILKKPDKKLDVTLLNTKYKVFPYENELLYKELETFLNISIQDIKPVKGGVKIGVQSKDLELLSKLTFCSAFSVGKNLPQDTNQAQLEGSDGSTKKKQSKYVTHGIHAYKGKFYPQLAKSLINISGIKSGATILDPFCGSGTVLLEAYLNGFNSLGSDMNPIAVKIAKAKTEVLQLDFGKFTSSISTLISYLRNHTKDLPPDVGEFAKATLDDVYSWFPEPVVHKINFILHRIRLFGDLRLVNFLEVILSECIRNASQQEPKDLRIRRRSEPLEDAPLIEEFCAHLEATYKKIKKFKTSEYARSECINESQVYLEDNRCDNYLENIKTSEGSVDLVITSPPYATALPYIDTDRLSLLTILGMPIKDTRVLEREITGSREIQKKAKSHFESLLTSKSSIEFLPDELLDELRFILNENLESGAGFRRLNTPSVLLRYFLDMAENLKNVYKALKSDGVAFYIIGDSKTKVKENWFPIRTTFWVSEIATKIGFESEIMMDISVTTENLLNQKHAITENAILKLVR